MYLETMEQEFFWERLERGLVGGCSDEFHVVVKHFQNLENLDFEHFEGKTFISMNW